MSRIEKILKCSDIDVGHVIPWNGWCDIDYCKLCGKNTYEKYVLYGIIDDVLKA